MPRGPGRRTSLAGHTRVYSPVMDFENMSLEQKLKMLDALYLVAMKLTQHLPHGHACGCTEWQAAWCPIHGDCRGCQTSLRLEWQSDCPLHGYAVPVRMEPATL